MKKHTKNKALCKTTVFKNKIDECSDDIIKSVEYSQLTWIKLSKEVNEISMNKTKRELDKITKQFETLVINDQKFENIKQSLDV